MTTVDPLTIIVLNELFSALKRGNTHWCLDTWNLINPLTSVSIDPIDNCSIG